MAEKLGFAGCLGLGVTLTGKNAIKFGAAAVLGGPVLWLINFMAFGADWEGWSGAVAYTTAIAVFCAGLCLLAIGGVRIGWSKLHS